MSTQSIYFDFVGGEMTVNPFTWCQRDCVRAVKFIEIILHVTRPFFVKELDVSKEFTCK